MQNKATPKFRSRKSKARDDAEDRRKASRCLSCHAPVTWRKELLNERLTAWWKEEDHTWVPYDYASDVKHRCK